MEYILGYIIISHLIYGASILTNRKVALISAYLWVLYGLRCENLATLITTKFQIVYDYFEIFDEKFRNLLYFVLFGIS